MRERPTAGHAGRAFRRREPRGGRRAARQRAKAAGVNVTAAPAELPRSAGGGYGFQFKTPEGHVLNISADVARHQNVNNDRSVPNKLSHVVLNSAKIDQQTSFFIDTLGFKLSDTDRHDGLRALQRRPPLDRDGARQRPDAQPLAYEVASIDGLMRGAGRMKKHGFNVEWGIGRHGPGDNVFGYFVEPNGFVVEYTAEVAAGRRGDLPGARRRILAQVPDAPVPLGHGRHAVQPLQGGGRPATSRSPIRKPASAAKRSWRRRWGGSTCL